MSTKARRDVPITDPRVNDPAAIQASELRSERTRASVASSGRKYQELAMAVVGQMSGANEWTVSVLCVGE